jgi:hypothetical protein
MNQANENQSAEPSMRFEDLEARYGARMAYDLLLTIEKLAKIQDEIAKAVASHDERLQRAMGRLESVNFGEMQ